MQGVEQNRIAKYINYLQTTKVWITFLVAGSSLLVLWLYYQLPIRGGDSLLFKLLYWIMVYFFALGVIPPALQIFTRPLKPGPDGSYFSFKRLLKGLLVGFIVMVLLFVLISML